MATNKLEVTLTQGGFGINRTLKLFAHSVKSEVILSIKEVNTRLDDGDEDKVTWHPIEVNIEELKNAIRLVEEAQFNHPEEDALCGGCGRP